MPQHPTWSDNDVTLWKKIASNYYDQAISSGATGLTPPNWNDNVIVLMKKVAYYTAVLAS